MNVYRSRLFIQYFKRYNNKNRDIDYSMIKSHNVLYNLIYQVNLYMPSEFIASNFEIITELTKLSDSVIDGYSDIKNKDKRDHAYLCVLECCQYIEHLRFDINNKVLFNNSYKLTYNQELSFHLILKNISKFLELFYLIIKNFFEFNETTKIKHLKLLYKIINNEKSNIYNGDYTIVSKITPSIFNLSYLTKSSVSVPDNMMGSINYPNYGSCN